MNWDEANEFIKELNKKRYCGYSDWRLPTVHELHSLIDYRQLDPALLLDNPFNNVQLFWYWTSTIYVHEIGRVWIIYMCNGHVSYSNKSHNSCVWPVRSGQCMTVDSSTRFTDNGNGTIIDNKTGLMWTKDANIQLAEDTV